MKTMFIFGLSVLAFKLFPNLLLAIGKPRMSCGDVLATEEGFTRGFTST